MSSIHPFNIEIVINLETVTVTQHFPDEITNIRDRGGMVVLLLFNALYSVSPGAVLYCIVSFHISTCLLQYGIWNTK